MENVRRKHNYLPLIMELLKILAKRGELVPLVEKVQLIFRTMRVCECVVCRLSVCVYGVYLPLLSLCVQAKKKKQQQREQEKQKETADTETAK